MASDRLQCRRKQSGFRLPLLRFPFRRLGCRARCSRSYDVRVEPSQLPSGHWVPTETISGTLGPQVEIDLYQGGRMDGDCGQGVMQHSNSEPAQVFAVLQQDATDMSVDENINCAQASNQSLTFPSVEHQCEGVEMLPVELDCDPVTLSLSDSEPACSSRNQGNTTHHPAPMDPSTSMASMETDAYVDPETGERGFG